MKNIDRDYIYELAQDFANKEIQNLNSVRTKTNIPLAILLEKNFSSGKYEITESVGQIPKKFFKKNLPEGIFDRLNNGHYESFEKIVNTTVRNWVNDQLNLSEEERVA